MKLQLEQSEIEKAVREYVANQGIKVEGKELTVKFTMTRGDSGLLVDLSIDEPKPVETKKPAAKLGTVGAIIRDQPADKKEAEVKPKVDPAAAKAAISQALSDAAASQEAKAAGQSTEAADPAAVGGDAAGAAAETKETAAAVVEEAKEEAPATSGPAKSLFG